MKCGSGIANSQNTRRCKHRTLSEPYIGTQFALRYDTGLDGVILADTGGWVTIVQFHAAKSILVKLDLTRFAPQQPLQKHCLSVF